MDNEFILSHYYNEKKTDLYGRILILCHLIQAMKINNVLMFTTITLRIFVLTLSLSLSNLDLPRSHFANRVSAMTIKWSP